MYSVLVVCTRSRVEFFFTRLVSGYCDKSAKEKVEKMIDVDTKVAQKSSCSIMLSISRVVSQLIARAAPPRATTAAACSIPEDHAIIIITLQLFFV